MNEERNQRITESRKKDRHKNNGDRHREGYKRPNTKPHPGTPYVRKDTFIAIKGGTVNTGEVVERNGVTAYVQSYVMMTASTKDGMIDCVVNRDGLSTEECFEFLLKLSRDNPNGIFVFLGSTLDVNSWLENFSKEKLVEIYEKAGNRSTFYKPPNGRHYSLRYKPRNSFSLSGLDKDHPWGFDIFDQEEFYQKISNFIPEEEEVHGEYDLDYKPDNEDEWSLLFLEEGPPKLSPKINKYAGLIIYDVSGFLQGLGSLPNILGDEKKGLLTDCLIEEDIDGTIHEIIKLSSMNNIDLTTMRAMKRNRGKFRHDQIGEMLSCCSDETTALAAIMDRVRASLLEAGIDISQWYGPGAAASRILQQAKFKDAIKENIPDKSLKDVQQRAYSGGRFETLQFGFFLGKIFHYDQHSAFNAPMPKLPMCQGRCNHEPILNWPPW